MEIIQPWSPQPAPSLVAAALELTNRCNLRCAHCASVSGRARKDELTLDQWLGVLDDLAALGTEEVTLLGGEVFLFDGWRRIGERVLALGMELRFITNGLLVDDRVLDDLLKLDFGLLGISLDGGTSAGYRAVRGVDGFERVMGLIRKVRDADVVDVNAITTLSKLNIGELSALHELLRQEDGVNWQVQCASTGAARFDEKMFVTAEQHAATCLQIGEWMFEGGDNNWIVTMDDFGYFPIDARHHFLHFEWGGCQAGRAVIGVRANGDVLPCLSLGDAFVDGNLKETPLRELWSSPETFASLRAKTGAHLQGFCAACPMAPRCGAGCAAMALSSTGSIYENRHCLRRHESLGIVDDVLAEADELSS